MLSSISRVDSDFVGSKAYAILQALFKKNNIKSNIKDTKVNILILK